MGIHYIFRTVGLARRNFFANGKRNFLSILTVILGSLAIGAVLTVNENVDVYVDSLIARSGGPNIYASLGGRGLVFDSKDVTEIRALPSVRYVAMDAQAGINAIAGAVSANVTMVLADGDYLAARPLTQIEGQFLSKWDESSTSHNLVISPEAADKLKLKAPIDELITLNVGGRSIVARVIGIAKPLYDTQDRGSVWVPRALFEDMLGERGQGAVIVGFSSYELLREYEARLRQTLEPKFKTYLRIYNPLENFEQMRRDYGTFITAGAIIGVLALLAGSVGVMNMMLIGIQLRTREIGLYRALGFSTGIVLLAFLTESMMILGSGGLIGSMLGCGFGFGIASQIVTTPPFLSQTAFALASLSSLIIGFVFAYVPARRASSMDTVEALRA